jgi:hypothetical protein
LGYIRSKSLIEREQREQAPVLAIEKSLHLASVLMGLKSFDPAIHDVEEWLRVFDQMATTNNWSEAIRVKMLPWFMARDVAVYVREKCTDAEGQEILITWNTLKQKLIAFFYPDEDCFTRQSKMYQRKWDQVEPLQTYWLAKMRLIRRLSIRPSFQDTISFYLLGLPEHVRKHLTGQYETTDEAFRAAFEVIDWFEGIKLGYHLGNFGAVENRDKDRHCLPHLNPLLGGALMQENPAPQQPAPQQPAPQQLAPQQPAPQQPNPKEKPLANGCDRAQQNEVLRDVMFGLIVDALERVGKNGMRRKQKRRKSFPFRASQQQQYQPAKQFFTAEGICYMEG